MKYPEHPGGIEKNRRARAPYNFVPLPEKIVTLPLKDLPGHHMYDKDRLSGFLDCELTTESPLYVRSGRSPGDNRDKKKPEFFHVFDKEQPVIPGSTLRGMLRNLIEIVSFSKISCVSEQNLVYRAIGDMTTHGQRYRDKLMRDDGRKHFTPLIQGGYMKKNINGGWAIRPAQTIDGTTYAHIPHRTLRKLNIFPCMKTKLYIETGPYQYQPVRGGFIHVKYARVRRAFKSPQTGLRKAFLACSGPMASKRTEIVVYEEDKKADLLPINDEAIITYRNQLEDCREQQNVIWNALKNEPGAKEKEIKRNGVLQDGYPVLYISDDNGDVVFFGHCRMFRLPYGQNVADFVPGELREPRDTDLAEAIFGYTKDKNIPEGKARAYAGRIFVSDAFLKPGQESPWMSPKTIIPKILASPKPTCFQHYLVQTHPNRKIVGKQRNGKPKYAIRLFDYEARSPGETVIRGHKMYWHKGPVSCEDIRESKPVKKNDKQHTEIQPVRPGIKFKFRINFDNLSKIELGAILWVLSIASDETYRLKIGMGKPLGMGAVKIKYDLKLIDNKKRYQKLFHDDGWAESIYEDKDIIPESKAGFERFVLDRLGDKSVRQLKENKRIQALLTLLNWPGPEKELTRYMEIERHDPGKRRGKFNEYRGRPVLPTPFEALSIPGSGYSEEDNKLPSRYKEGIVLGYGLGPNKSYGYIEYINIAGNKEKCFVHKSQLGKGVKHLEAGQRVTFEIRHGMKGLQAFDVQLRETE